MAVAARGLSPSPARSVVGVKRRAPVEDSGSDTKGKAKEKEKGRGKGKEKESEAQGKEKETRGKESEAKRKGKEAQGKGKEAQEREMEQKGKEKEEDQHEEEHEEESEEEEEESEEEEGKERKKVHLQTDEEKAQLVKLCIKHFARYPEGKEKFWKYMKNVWAEEMKTRPPSVKEFMKRHEKIWKKQLEQGDFSYPALLILHSPLGVAQPS
jgi:hypothetical protein